MASTIHEKGYVTIPFLEEAQLNSIKQFYTKEHSLNSNSGGMFYSMYSKDLAYRKRVHEFLQNLLAPILEKYFIDYKNVVNTFITKASGPESEFYVHQDTTALDEFKHSPLSIWIPLQDITSENGALGVMEKSHWFFSPFRGISFPFPFSKINDTVKDYLKPIYLKAGEALIFDPRIVHNSFGNNSGGDRIVALCGVFPKDAELITCFKEKIPESRIELLKQDDSYLLENESFYYDCHSRPKTGKVIAKIENDFPEIDVQTFEKLCELNAIPKLTIIEKTLEINCNFIAEPNGINFANDVTKNTEANSIARKVWKTIKTAFH